MYEEGGGRFHIFVHANEIAIHSSAMGKKHMKATGKPTLSCVCVCERERERERESE